MLAGKGNVLDMRVKGSLKWWRGGAILTIAGALASSYP
jgi:hypothetical protein